LKIYKAVLFDMDGVIVDSMNWHAEAWQKAFHGQGIELTKEEIFKREGMSGLASVIDIIREKGGTVPDKEKLELLQNNKLEIFETGSVHIYPLAVTIIEFVRGKNLKTGLVTGSLRRSVEFILPENIRSLFDVIVPVEDTLYGKPHPEPYLNAMSRIKCKPEDTLVIENAPLGIASAKKAGADCIAIETTLDSSFLKEADRIFKDHKSLLKHLEDIL
jgi:beta-phosphoglucomutase